MGIFQYGHFKAFLIASAGRVKAIETLHNPPTIIASIGYDINLLCPILPHITGPKPIILRIKTEAPGIPETIGVNFFTMTFRIANKWIVGRYGIISSALLTDDINPIRIATHVWDNYLNEREAYSSFWILPSADHYPQREKPDAVAKVVRLALSGQLPARETEPEFMRQYSSRRTGEDAIYVGYSRIEPLNFPSSIEYTPLGYRLKAVE
jgi:hypothetical protein